MWVDKDAIVKILEVCPSTAYKIISNLKKELAEKGFFVNPNAKVPIKYFCERFDLNETEVKEALKSPATNCRA